MGQKSENEKNKNRSYDEIDKRIRETYAKDSTATLKNKLYDPYVRFFRWAIDRLGARPGIVCFVSNNSFVDHAAFDGMRKHLLRDFSRVYHVDLHGDVNRDRTLSGTQHNVFGIQLGVGITVAVRREGQREDDHSLHYHRVPERWTRIQKLAWLAERKDISRIDWQALPPFTWPELETAGAFGALLPLGTKEAKKLNEINAQAIFKSYTIGVLTARDEIAYDFSRKTLIARMEKFVDDYNAEVDRYHRAKQKEKQRQKKPIDIDEFVGDDLKWTHNLKRALEAEHSATTQPSNYRRSLYRPFCKKWLFFDRMLNERVYLTPGIFPNEMAEAENMVICCTSHTQMPFSCMVTNLLPNEAVGGRNGQCFGRYTYSEDGHERSGNITDWALTKFRHHYGDKNTSKLDIFHYVYAILHHPLYRERFAQNLQKEIPRLPLAKAFKLCASIGKRLVDLHLNYEQAEPFELGWIENPNKPLSYRVTGRMRLDKEAGTIEINSSLTLAGIPELAFDYVLGTRSTLEWIVDQYRYEQDEDGTVTSDPNDPENDKYIVQLIGRVTTVSLETLALIRKLPTQLDFTPPNAGRKQELML